MTRERLHAFFTREVALRLLASVALALILWALVTVRQDPETTRAFNDVPVQALSLADSLVLVNEVGPVRVQLSGPESDIAPIEAGALAANIDFSEITQPGVYELPISLPAPNGVWRSSVTPATASVVIERSESKSLRLVPVVTDLDQNSLRTVTVYPQVNQVKVTGPTSLIESIKEVVLPVKVSGGTQTFQDVFIPEAHDKDGNVVEGIVIEPSAVNATVRVSARGKSVAVLSTIEGSPAPGYEVADRTVNPQFIIVDGDEALLDSLVALSTEPIDVTGADASFNRKVGIADLPEGLQILQPASGQVEVLVQIAQRGVHQSLPSQQVTVVGASDGLIASVTPDEITIQVIAPDDALAGLDATSLQVIVDATGLAAGTYTVEPSVIMPPRVQWVATFPSEVTLTLVPENAGTPAASISQPAGRPQAVP